MNLVSFYKQKKHTFAATCLHRMAWITIRFACIIIRLQRGEEGYISPWYSVTWMSAVWMPYIRRLYAQCILNVLLYKHYSLNCEVFYAKTHSLSDFSFVRLCSYWLIALLATVSTQVQPISFHLRDLLFGKRRCMGETSRLSLPRNGYLCTWITQYISNTNSSFRLLCITGREIQSGTYWL